MATNQPPVTDNRTLNAWLIEATKNTAKLQSELLNLKKDIREATDFADLQKKVKAE